MIKSIPSEKTLKTWTNRELNTLVMGILGDTESLDLPDFAGNMNITIELLAPEQYSWHMHTAHWANKKLYRAHVADHDKTPVILAGNDYTEEKTPSRALLIAWLMMKKEE